MITAADPISRYRRLIEQVDAMIADLEAIHRDFMRCRAGCCQCCTLTSVLAIEAAVLGRAVARLPDTMRRRLGQGEGEVCPLLIDSRCAVYAERPLICRTHGLPIGYVDHDKETVAVSACPVNFPADYAFALEELLLLDRVNEELAAVNLPYCRARGFAPERRIAMSDIVAGAGFFVAEGD